jgi:uncharacterized RDD family membrane protein YckC
VRDITEPTEPGELAGRGARAWAATIDGLIGIVLALPLIGSGLYVYFRHQPANGLLGAAGLVTSIAFIVWAIITIRFVRQNGQSIGKRMMDIKVVRNDGSPASLGRIFWLRNVVASLPGAIPYAGYIYRLVDILLIFGEQRRCVHDRIADTIVIKA